MVDLHDGETATARYNTLVFRHDGPPGAPPPAPIGLPLSIAAAQDRLRRDAASGAWLVVERRSSRVFGV